MKDNLKNNITKNLTFTFYHSGDFEDEGIYVCKNCGQKLFLSSGEKLPNCKRCGFSVFTKQ